MTQQTGSFSPNPVSGPDVQPYTGVRIIDLTHDYGRYTGRLFADMGAEVIRVEPESGLPDRRRLGGDGFDAQFAYLNANKKSVVLDVDTESGSAAFESLARSAQVILLERDGPLFDAAARLRALKRDLVVTAISPFGMTGPLADAPASDLVLQAAGGIAWMSGRIDDTPLSLPFDQATMVGSIYAAMVTSLAFYDAEVNGNGHLIDVSVQECIAHSLQNAVQVWDLERRVSIRGGIGTRDATEDIFPCKDGFVFLASPLSLGGSWPALVRWISETGSPSGPPLSDERWSNREWRLTQESRDEFRQLFTAFTRELDKATLTREAIARRVVLGPVQTIADIFDDPQLASRGYFTSMALVDGREIRLPGAPYKLTPQVWRTGPAPALGADTGLIQENAG